MARIWGSVDFREELTQALTAVVGGATVLIVCVHGCSRYRVVAVNMIMEGTAVMLPTTPYMTTIHPTFTTTINLLPVL